MERIKFYKQHDIGIVFCLMYGNKKVYPKDPYDAEA